jgi:hypothetical protein
MHSLNSEQLIKLYEHTHSADDSERVRNLVSDIKDGTHTEGVSEQGAENLWTKEE